MENKIKAVLATFLSILFAALLTYAFTKNVQFIGVLLVAVAVIALAVGMYKTFLDIFNNDKSNK
jgi:ABC-type glycerol-3-phosphate transport system permease component